MRSGMLPELLAGLGLLGLVGCYSAGGSGVSGESSLAPAIQAQPQSQTVALGGTATFQVTGSGTPLPSYQWERSNNTGTSWTPIAGATGTTFAVANASTADNQAQFHVILADPAGSATSAGATLSVTANVGDCQTVASLAPQSVPMGITVGPDGNLWFTNSGKGQIGKMDAITHQVALVNLPNPACKPVGIAAGPDGNLWFTEQVDGKVGVVTTGGVLNNEFPVGQGPTALVTGPDGNLWTTLQTGNQIARLTPSGSVTLFPVPTAHASPSGITRAPDGTLWFTEQASARIGQISPAGAITEWALQLPSGGVTPVPVAITTTADGAIWYSDPANNNIAKFSPAAQAHPAARLREFLEPAFLADTLVLTIFFPLAPGANPNGVTTDVEGRVWVTEQGTGQVAEITVTTAAGTTPITFDLPTPNGAPVNVTVGADGNLYLTESGMDDVVMVVGNVPTSNVTVTVLPATANVVDNGIQTFQAMVLGTPTNTVTWSVLEGASGGTVTPDTGVYLAPATAGTYHVVATSNAVTPAVTGTAAVTVTVPTISAISPANPTAQAGTNMVFSAQVTGLSDNSVVWSASDGVMNAATGVWTVPDTAETVTITATSNLDSALYTTTLAVIPPSGSALPNIITMPANQSAASGGTATFTVAVNGVTTALYQWQVSTNGGSTWTNVSTGTGGTAASYTTAATAPADDGNLYQVVISNGAGGSVTSNAARLTVTYAPVIVTQPTSAGVLLGAKATFSVTAIGEPAPGFQWQVSTDGGLTWANVTTGTGGASATYTTAATTAGVDNNQFQVLVGNGIGAGVSSAAATLTVTTTPLGITAPPANQSVLAGNPATFTVVAYGTPAPTYQWQVSTDGGATWGNIGGATSASYGTGATTSANDGNLFQVVITNGATVTSPAAKLTVQYLPVITTAPVNQTVTQPAPATFSVAASGDPAPGFQWQLSTDGGSTWNNVPSGGTSASYTTPATGVGNSGNQYQVLVTNAAGTASASAILTVLAPALVITSEPANQTVPLGTAATFTVAAAGIPLPTYQWQASTDGGSTWANVGTGAASFSTGATSYGNNGTLYQVLVTSGATTLVSTAAHLTVLDPPPTLPSIAAPASAYPGASGLSASVPAQSAGSTYAWSITNGNGSVTGSGNTATFTVGTAGNTILGCVVTNAAGVASAQATFPVAIVGNPVVSLTFPSGGYITPIGALPPTTTGVTGTAQVTSQAGWSYAWAISNGTIQTGAGTSQVTFTALSSSPVQLSCTVTDLATGGSTLAQGSVMGVDAPAQPTVVAPTDVTATVAGTYQASVTVQPGCTYAWTVTNATPATSTASSFYFTPTSGGTSPTAVPVGLSCVVYNAALTPSTAGTASPNAWAMPTATLTATPPYLPPLGGTVTLTGAFTGGSSELGNGGPGSYNLGSQGGPSGTWSLTSTQSGGTLTYAVTVTNPAGTVVSATAMVGPAITLSTPDVQIAPGQGCTFSATVQCNPGDSISWSISPDGGNWYGINTSSSPWAFANPDSTIAGYLPGVASGIVQVSGVSSAVLSPVPASVNTVTTSLTLGNLPLEPAFFARLTLNSATQALIVQVLSPYANATFAAGANHMLLLQPGQNPNAYSPTNGYNYVWACGKNDLGQLGNGQQVDSTAFQFVQEPYSSYSGQAELYDIQMVDAAGDHSLAEDNLGNVWWWGASPNGIHGPIPNTQAAMVSGLPPSPVQLTETSAYGVGLYPYANQNIYYWQTGGSASPVGNFTGSYLAVAASDTDGTGVPFLAAVDGSGNVYEDELGGEGAHWLHMGNPPSMVAVFARTDNNLVGLDVSGQVWSWAIAYPPTSIAPPTQLTFTLDPTANPVVPATVKAVALAKGPGFILALDSGGNLWVWGTLNDSGQLGAPPSSLTSSGGYFIPVVINGGPTFTAIAAGNAFGLALDVFDNFWSWGFEGAGELANAATAIQAPVQLSYNAVNTYPWYGLGYPGPGWNLPVGAGSDVLFEGASNGSYTIWGSDPGLYLNSTPAPSQVPVPLFYSSYNAESQTTSYYPPPAGQIYGSALSGHALIVDGAFNLWAWGLNKSGQCGVAPSLLAPLATVSGVSGVLKAATGASHSLALDVNNALWAWGSNASGQLGLTSPAVSTTSGSTPALVYNPLANLEQWLGCAAGTDFSVGITNVGVWVWGANEHGQIGLSTDGPDGALYPPSEMTYNDGFSTAIMTQVVAGSQHILTLDANGNVWSWGGGQAGQLGNGSNYDSSSPTPILGPAYGLVLVNSNPIVQVCAGPDFSLALDDAGNVWGWGNGCMGALPGSGNAIVSTPIQLSTPSSLVWLTATATSVVAMDSAGGVWTWGWNLDGMLGTQYLANTYSYLATPAMVTLTAPSNWDTGFYGP